MTYDPKKDLIKLGGKDYLEVKFRLIWLRDLHPAWGVETELLQLDAVAIVKASIKDETGRVIASGHGMAKTGGSAKWAGREIEKAETAAIGRALAHAGIGTQFIDDETEGEGDHDHIADSPVERKSQGKSAQQKPATQKPLETPAPTFDATTGATFQKWITSELALDSADDVLKAFTNAYGDPVSHILNMSEWPYEIPEAIGACIAYKCEYDAGRINAFIDNAKRTSTFKNSAKVAFTPAYLENYRALALKLVSAE
jgi:hypothetical protein